ncbi:MAG: hypothetical protein ACK5RG_06735 [Cyclobacteriaceae bacterium]|jgi:hypothetical protein|nr:hypothetical protein [Flammeovirgaceae bacterium]
MKFIFTSAFLLFFATSTVAQTDSIRMTKVFGGYKYFQNNQGLTVKQLGVALEANPEASKLFQQAKPNGTAATIFGMAGGFLVGWPIGTAIAGGKPSWELAGIGAGLIVISIPFSSVFNKKTKEAVSIYNQGNKTSTIRKRTELKFNVSPNQVGVVMKF